MSWLKSDYHAAAFWVVMTGLVMLGVLILIAIEMGMR